MALLNPMNLYKFHDDPEKLHNEKLATDTVPRFIFTKYEDKPAELKKREDAIGTDAHYSLKYARDYLNGPFPKGEAAIAKNEYDILHYVEKITHQPFKAAEPFLRKHRMSWNRYCDYLAGEGFKEYNHEFI